MNSKKFYFGQYWQVYGTNSIDVPEDFTKEQAIAHARKTWDNVGLAPESSYVMGSDEPDFENCSFEDTGCSS